MTIFFIFIINYYLESNFLSNKLSSLYLLHLSIFLKLKDSLDLICNFRLNTFHALFNSLSDYILGSYFLYFSIILLLWDIISVFRFIFFFTLIIIIVDALIKSIQRICWNILLIWNIITISKIITSIFFFFAFYKKLLSNLLNRDFSSICYFTQSAFEWLLVISFLAEFSFALIWFLFQLCADSLFTSISSHESA